MAISGAVWVAAGGKLDVGTSGNLELCMALHVPDNLVCFCLSMV